MVLDHHGTSFRTALGNGIWTLILGWDVQRMRVWGQLSIRQERIGVQARVIHIIHGSLVSGALRFGGGRGM